MTPADLTGGNLASKFDVVILPGGIAGRSDRGVAGTSGSGRQPDSGRAGCGVSSTNSGTAGPAARAVDDFVRAGGIVLSCGSGASRIAQTLQLPVRSTTAGLSREHYFTGTSIMRVVIDTTHPVMAGMPGRAYVTVNQPLAFATTDGFEGAVLATFPSTKSPLRSGFLTPGTEKYLQSYAAALDVKHGRGHVVLMAFNPNWRGQSTASFRMLVNTLFFGKDAADQSSTAPGF